MNHFLLFNNWKNYLSLCIYLRLIRKNKIIILMNNFFHRSYFNKNYHRIHTIKNHWNINNNILFVWNDTLYNVYSLHTKPTILNMRFENNKNTPLYGNMFYFRIISQYMNVIILETQKYSLFWNLCFACLVKIKK